MDAKENPQDTIATLKARIHELEQAEQALIESRRALQQSERRFREILEDVSEISIQGYDENRRVTFWNSASEALYGYTEKEALGRRFEELIIPEAMRQSVVELHRRWITHGEKIPAGELVLVAKDGSDVPVYSSHTTITTDHGTEMFCIDVDLSRIKKIEQELQRSRYLLDLLNTHTSAFVSIFDHNGRFLFTSQSWRSMGYDPKALLGTSGFSVVAEQDAPRLKRLLSLVRHEHRSNIVLEFHINDSKGQLHLLRGSFNTVFDDAGSISSFICVAENITELRQAQAEKLAATTRAAESEKLALVGKISGRMAHDFNNVLGAILGNTELAQLICQDDRIAEKLQLIHDQTLRGRNLTRNLVAFARDQEPEQEFFPLEEKIRLVIKLMTRDLGNISINCDFEPDLPRVLADPGMIEHALVNLLQNAIHATSKTDNPTISLHLFQRQNRIVLTISDNGCGIPAEDLKKVFEPSFSLKGSKDKHKQYMPDIRGTGYGMTSAQKYLQKHGGDIVVTSALNNGTCVEIRLPVLNTPDSRKTVNSLANVTESGSHSILLVEDEPAISAVQQRMLEAGPANHRVQIAENGQAALDLLANTRYDCICIDNVLPGNYSGMDLYRMIRNSGSTVPVLFISGNLEFIESIRELKAADPQVAHLAKPFQGSDLIREVNRLLAIHQDEVS